MVSEPNSASSQPPPSGSSASPSELMPRRRVYSTSRSSIPSRPIGLEGIDDLLVEYTRRRGINSEGLALLPEGGGWLLAEFGSDTIAAAEAQASGLMQALNRGPNPPQMRLFTNREQIRRVW